MKTSTKLTTIFAILVVIAIGVGVKFLVVKADTKTIFTISDEIGTGKVLGIHHFTLKEGVDPQEFERFVAEGFIPLAPEHFLGWNWMVMKGERGSHVGQYIEVYEINSLYARNYYSPEPGELSEQASAILEKWGDPWTQWRNRFNEMVERSEWTDYVALVKK